MLGVTVTPRNLAELRAITTPEEIVAAATAYIAQRKQAITEALHIRDAAIRVLANQVGPAEAARRTGLSLSYIKAIKAR
jgi:hypothetical protein